MEKKTTLIVGGAGKTGARVAQRLADKGFDNRLASRSSQPVFDWEDPAGWAEAVRGAHQAYVTYYPDLAFPGGAEQVRTFARVAVDSGVRRLVLLSGRGEVGALAGEQAVQESGADWTIVRSAFMNQNFSESFWLEPVLAGELAVPAGDTAEPFIDADDVADVAVAALTEDRHNGEVYEVTGPRLLTFGDVVEEISRAVGRDIQYAPVTSDEFKIGMIAEGIPADFAAALTELFRQVLDGRNSHLADGVGRALGREPKDFRDYARETAAKGVWDTGVTAGPAAGGGVDG